MNQTDSNNINNKDKDKQQDINNTGFEVMQRIVDYEPNHNYIFRICLLGDSSVGKTSLLTRYCDGTFKDKYSSTIGIDFRVVTLKYKDIIAKVHIWDTAGQERFKSIAINYFRSSNGFIFLYDITRKDTFTNIFKWVELAFANCQSAVVNFWVGNKCDIANKREVSVEEAESVAKMRGFSYLETSAWNGDNVDRMFEFFAYQLIQYFKVHKNLYEENIKEGGTKVVDIVDTKRTKEECRC